MQSPGLAGLMLIVLVHAPLAGQYPPSESPQAPAPSPVKLSGYIQAREVYQSRVGLTGSINRARLSASSAILQGVTWRVQGEFRTGSVGTGRASVALQDATVVDSLAPKRDIGLMAEYTYRRIGVWAGVFNGEGQNVTANTDSTMLGVARLAVRVLPQLALGVNGARYFGDSTRYGVDAAYEDDRFALKGEYLGQARDEGAGPDDRGWYGLGAVYVIPAVQAVAKYEEFARPAVTTTVKNRAWTAGFNVYPSGRNLRLTFDYLSRRIGEPGVRKARLLAQVQARF